MAVSEHVVEIHDFDVLPDGRPMLVMEWIDGRDLGRLIREEVGGIEEARALKWMRDTARGMLAAACEGVIHRDLKPSNVFLDRDGDARVVDFGLARHSAERAEPARHGEIMGSPWYMAPEQAEDPRGVDTRADIYSFGATFYHLLTGRPAFDGPNWFSILQQHKSAPLRPPRAINPTISERTSEIIERCMSKAAAGRFGSFADVLAVLDPDGGAPAPWDAEHDHALDQHLDRYRRRRAAYLAAADGTGAAARAGVGVMDVYRFPGARSLVVLCGTIVTQDVEAIVSCDDEQLTMRSGVARAIADAAGPQMELEARRFVPVRVGRAVVTSAGQLTSRFVFHGITLRAPGTGGSGPSRDVICEILASCVYQAETLHVSTIALPLLATGNGGFSREICLDTLFRFLARALLRGLSCLREVRIVLF